MASSSRVALAVGAFLGLLFAAFQVQFALSGSGPYVNPPAVKVGTIVGAVISYVGSFSFIALTTVFARSVRARLPRMLTLVGLAAFAAIAALLAPLAPTGALALGCKTELLCPAAANLLSWALMELVVHWPLAPVLAGILVVAVTANLPGLSRASE